MPALMLTSSHPFLPVSVFLLLTLGGVLGVQAVGQFADISLVAPSLPIAAMLAARLTFGTFYKPTKANMAALALTLLAFFVHGYASRFLWDMSSDGLGYQQPGAEAILHGYNPLHSNADMIWLNRYPTAAWELEAALAWLFDSIEATRSLQFFWMLAALPLLFAGLSSFFKRPLTKTEALLAALMVCSPTVLNQWLTHYVDAMLYLSGVCFLGALGLYDDSRRQKLLALLLMGICVCFMINVKLSGLYHAFVWCACAVLYIWMRTRKIPFKFGFALMSCGLFSLLVIGFHPYITSFKLYGALMPVDSSIFSGFQRPANLTDMPSPARFLYSMFSETGGAPRVDARLKCPLVIHAHEWRNAGAADSRTGGLGIWFALATISALVAGLLAFRGSNKTLLGLAGLLLISSMLFPENWWARYVPFAYMSPLLVLLALPATAAKPAKLICYATMAVLFVNSSAAAVGGYAFFKQNLEEFFQLAAFLKGVPDGTVYLVPPGDDYLIYNHAHMPLQRRLAELGVQTSIRVGDACPHMVKDLSEFKLCY